jgi:hypothetical protein
MNVLALIGTTKAFPAIPKAPTFHKDGSGRDRVDDAHTFKKLAAKR